MSASARAIMIGGTASNVGKTSIAIGIMSALKRTGYRIGAAKVGPDYIDPSYHRIATNRPSYNLDPFMTGKAGVIKSYLRAAKDVDLVIVEGVMGLFDGTDKVGIDGAEGDRGEATILGGRYSSASVAKILGIPIVLVADARSMSSSIAAVIHGFRDQLGANSFTGVILNRVKSARHEELLRAALTSIGANVFGAIPDGAAPHLESQKLGLIPTEQLVDHEKNVIETLGDTILQFCDLTDLVSNFKSCTATTTPDSQLPIFLPADRITIAVATGKAFSFNYAENLELLQESGAEIAPFDPEFDSLPDNCDAIVAGGGFPQLFGAQIDANQTLAEQVRFARNDGIPIWAECGGMMWLGRSIDGHKAIGVLNTATRITNKLNLGYRSATTTLPSLLFNPDEVIFGHEFHYSIASPPGDSLVDTNSKTGLGGFCDETLFASYLHIHLSGHEQAKNRLIKAAQAYKAKKNS